MKWYCTGTGIYEMMGYSKGTVDSTLLHYYLINFVVNSHVYDAAQSILTLPMLRLLSSKAQGREDS